MRRLLLVGVLLPLLWSCNEIKTSATGHDDEILVFADDSTWTAFGPTLKGIFQDTIRTPQPEAWYTLRFTPFEQFNQYETVMNRIVIAPLSGRGSVAEFMRQSLDSAVRQLVLDGKEFAFNKYDSKARGQLLMFLTGRDGKGLQAMLDNKAADLLYYFKSTSLKRELASIGSERAYQKKVIERSLLDHYGWTMTIQHDYFVAIDSSQARFFWMRRATPADMERWIFVSWTEARDPGILTDRFAMRMRDSLTHLYMKTVSDDAYVEIAPYNLEMENVSFLNRFAYTMRGNWRFSDKSGGGPFVNYTFYDETTGRIYMLDGSIFAPRVEKKKLILQVDALLHTFKSASELSENERKQLGP